jgi:hypothetical protein
VRTLGVRRVSYEARLLLGESLTSPGTADLVDALAAHDESVRVYAAATAAWWREHTTGDWTRAGGTICIQRVAGRRCMHRDFADCRLPGADHSTVWRDEEGRLIYVTQPYDLLHDSLAAMFAKCRDLGLELDVSAAGSWHFPGWTLLCVARLPGPPPPRAQRTAGPRATVTRQHAAVLIQQAHERVGDAVVIARRWKEDNAAYARCRTEPRPFVVLHVRGAHFDARIDFETVRGLRLSHGGDYVLRDFFYHYASGRSVYMGGPGSCYVTLTRMPLLCLPEGAEALVHAASNPPMPVFPPAPFDLGLLAAFSFRRKLFFKFRCGCEMHDGTLSTDSHCLEHSQHRAGSQ